MRLDFKFGRADTSAHFRDITEMAATHPQGYDTDSHLLWATEKLLPRMKAGEAIACPVYHEDQLVAVAVGYPEQPKTDNTPPRVEAKLVRTLDRYTNRGLARLAIKTLVAATAETMRLPTGSDLRVFLDTRNPDLSGALQTLGFTVTGTARLYLPDPEKPEVADILLERTFRTPQLI